MSWSAAGSWAEELRFQTESQQLHSLDVLSGDIRAQTKKMGFLKALLFLELSSPLALWSSPGILLQVRGPW